MGDLKNDVDKVSVPEEGEKSPRLPNLFWAWVPILSMVVLMAYVFGFSSEPKTDDAAPCFLSRSCYILSWE